MWPTRGSRSWAMFGFRFCIGGGLDDSWSDVMRARPASCEWCVCTCIGGCGGRRGDPGKNPILAVFGCGGALGPVMLDRLEDRRGCDAGKRVCIRIGGEPCVPALSLDGELSASDGSAL